MNNENVRVIKRYQNRKLYDTRQSCYVTLEEISQIIRDGHEIKVIDNKTKRDITYSTQIQLLFDQEKKSKDVENTQMLKRVIRSESGVFSGYIKQLEQSLKIGDHKNEEKIIEIEETITIPEVNVADYMNRVNNGSIETPNTLN
jgi:polyhydroxyalkanoate synthesis repressor PhaR